MRVYEFRKDLKKAFDDALRGEEVLIERGGISFRLIADAVVGTVGKVSGVSVDNIVRANGLLMEAKVPEEGRYVQTPEGIKGPTKLESKALQFCKNGHPIPKGRDKCLGKGCKYS